jgi:8-oxo-dGTP pyrophosphatase MutT (NUDIX family)
MEWQNLGERPVYENRWFTVNLADVELPDGRHLDHDVIHQPDSALAAAINGADEVLLLWRHRFITGSWAWELPGGLVEDGEPVEQAAARELLEETGWRAGELHPLLTVEQGNGLSDALHHVYWTDDAVRIGQPADAFESGRREWVALRQVPELISPG